MTLSRMLLPALVAMVALSCDSATDLDERWARPESIQFAPSLNIDLAEMNRTASGLYWQDLAEGTGVAAAVGHDVVLHYRGWFPDGTLFDSSYDRNDPIEFHLGGGQVISGMDEGIVGMQPGGIRKLVIRPELAYGKRGKGPIRPLTTLVFEVELVSIRL